MKENLKTYKQKGLTAIEYMLVISIIILVFMFSIGLDKKSVKKSIESPETIALDSDENVSTKCIEGYTIVMSENGETTRLTNKNSEAIACQVLEGNTVLEPKANYYTQAEK